MFLLINFSIIFLNFILVSLANSYDNLSVNCYQTLPKIHAKSYILIDYHSGKVLAEMNADTRLYPASLTKLMTSYIISQMIKSETININDIVTIKKNASVISNAVLKGSSLMFLKPGDCVSVKQLHRGIILQSGNDASVALADYIAGSQDLFVRIMNKYVHKLGLKNTNFKNVHGLDLRGQFSSARDMAMLGKAIIHDIPDEYLTYQEKEFTYNNIHQTNRNSLLWDSYLNVDGIKTGYTNLAGYNIVASAVKGPIRLIVVVMGSNSIKDRKIESRKLLLWGFKCFKN